MSVGIFSFMAACMQPLRGTPLPPVMAGNWEEEFLDIWAQSEDGGESTQATKRTRSDEEEGESTPVAKRTRGDAPEEAGGDHVALARIASTVAAAAGVACTGAPAARTCSIVADYGPDRAAIIDDHWRMPLRDSLAPH